MTNPSVSQAVATGVAGSPLGTPPPSGKTNDPGAGLADGQTLEVDINGNPSPGGVELKRRGGKTYIRCKVRDKDLRWKPEEVVRQHILRQLMDDLGYAKSQIGVEVPVTMGSTVHDKPADIAVYADATCANVRLIVEVKKPRRKDGTDQLKSYMNATGAVFGWWTNGRDEQVLLRQDPNVFSLRLTRVPAPGESLADVDEPLTKARLRPVTDLFDLLTLCEDEILAHQNVNTFDELFKIVYAKLYDERMNLAGPSSVCEFRIGVTESPADAAKRVRGLYEKARKKWKGVFKDEIELNDNNLAFVVASLQEYEFIGDKSGDVLGVAFEALINRETKGDKGQYFTPRHITNMCVRMLNPAVDEKIWDPACGSAGFLISAMKHVNKGIDDKYSNPDQAAEHRKDYAQEYLIGSDNDPRLTRIAKAYMIVENDGRSNIHQADSLDPTSWDAEFRKKLGDVDVVLTNPPFAGGIKTPQILSQYDLAYKNDRSKHKQSKEVVRAILFLERCLRVLRPGGRMAIVLPQGLMNNVGDSYVRDFIDQQGRILAVVGLDENTFKPFTNAKTSVVFLEKWEGQSQRLTDYDFFIDVSRRPGKDKVGAPIFLHDGVTLDTDVMDIADNFRAWAKGEGFPWA